MLKSQIYVCKKNMLCDLVESFQTLQLNGIIDLNFICFSIQVE